MIKKGLNKAKLLINKIMEMIGENKYRISFVLLTFVFVIIMAYLFILLNLNSNFNQIISNPINWIISLMLLYLYKDTKPVVRQIWKQTDIRDNIAKQTSIKLELENLKTLKELGFEIDKEKISNEIKNLIKK